MITPSHPILSHHISYGFIAVFDAFDADHTPKATRDLCQLHLRQQIAWWKWEISWQVRTVRMELQPVDLNNDETTEIYPSQKKVDWAYKRWRFQQNWSNHETGVELKNMELLVTVSGVRFTTLKQSQWNANTYHISIRTYQNLSLIIITLW